MGTIFNWRCTKGVPFLSKLVYKRIRGFVSVIENVRTTVGIYMPMKALEHLIFFDLLSARKSTPRLNFVRGGDFRDFRYVAFTTVTLLVPFVQSGNDFEIPFIGFPCLNPFFKCTSDLTQEKRGELHPVHSLQRAVKKKKTATAKKTM